MKVLCALLLASVALLAGCSKPLDAVIPTDIATWDKELAPQMKKLSEEDRQKATAYLMRAKVGEVFGGKGIPFGLTLGQAVEAQKKWDADQATKQMEEAALKAKLVKDRAAATEVLNKAVTVVLVSKDEREPDYEARRYSREQVFKIGIQNNSGKPIVGVSGELKFIDVFDKEVGSVTFGMSQTIEPGQTVTWNGSRRYNQFEAEHRAVWNLEEGKFKTAFVPEAVIFGDGTSLKVPK